MQQFQVPQFITVEDRIIGPLTLRQFLYLLGAAGAAVVGWAFLHVILFVILVVPTAALFIAMAFMKINQRSLPEIFFAAANYYLKPRLYLWRQSHEERPAPQPMAAGSQPLLAGLPKLTASKLDDLAWSLDIKEQIENRR